MKNAVLMLALAACAQDRAPLKDADDFTYWLQKIDLAALGASRFDLAIIDHAHDGTEFTADGIAALRKNRVVLAYLSIGEAEDYRPYWKKEWANRGPAWLGPENPDWPGNYKVRYWHDEWKKIVLAYLDRILAQGFDGAYLDLIDAYEYWEERKEKQARARMIDWVGELSRHAKAKNKAFLLFVQNCEQLLEDETYFAAIDGIGREETYYVDGRRNKDDGIRQSERHLDKAAKAGKKVLIIEYLDDPGAIDWVYGRARDRGYVPYATVRELDRMVINKGHEPD